MDLPITPIFFRKVGIFQKLVDAEYGFSQKNIWEAEKAALIWAAGPNHQLAGSYITKKNIQDLLRDEINSRIKKGDQKVEKLFDFAISFPDQVMEIIVMHGFASEKGDGADSGNYSIRFNPDGFMAGNILIETNNLKSRLKYSIWVALWWPVLFLGGIILLEQALPDTFHLLKEIALRYWH